MAGAEVRIFRPFVPITAKKPCDAELRRDLASGQRHVQLAGLRKLAQAVPEWAADLSSALEQAAKLLGHQDYEVVSTAAAVLGRAGAVSGRHAEALGSLALNAPAPACRAAALEALRSIGPPARRDALKSATSCLRDSSSAVRAAALRALGAAADASTSATAVAGLLEDPDADVAGAAAEALGTLSSRSKQAERLFTSEAVISQLQILLQKPAARYSVLLALGRASQALPRLAPQVVEALSDEDIFIRHAAVAAVKGQAATITGSRDLEAQLLAVIRHPGPGPRAAALAAVASLGPAAAHCGEAVAATLTDPVDEAPEGLAPQMGGRRAPAELRIPRCAALLALGRIGAKAFAGRIAEFLNDAHWEVQVAACQSLGMLAAERQARSLISVLASRKTSFPVRSAACATLGKLKNIEALPVLVKCFEDKATAVRLSALRAVGELGQLGEDYCHEVFKLVNDGSAEIRAEAIGVLARLSYISQSYAGVAACMLFDQDARVRLSALQALMLMGPAGLSFIDEVNHLTGDENKEVRMAASAALDRMITQPRSQRKEAILRDSPEDPAEGSSHVYAYHQELKQMKANLQFAGKWLDGLF